MVDRWEGCYREGWQDIIVDEAFCHPAKFARALIRRIYEHAKNNGWIKPGDYVLDPFGGVALGVLDAMGYGLNWIGVELEEKFVKLGEQNIALWIKRLRYWQGLGTAKIIHGDSRNLKTTVKKMDIVISSPPMLNDYGHTPGQLGAMKEENFDVVVSSPPYSKGGTGHGQKDDDSHRKRKAERLAKGEFKYKRPDVFISQKNIGARAMFNSTYGQSPGQLANMKEGSIDTVISSPPYEEGIGYGGKMTEIDKKKALYIANSERYSRNKSNLGNSSGDTFWSASHEIVQQCFNLLKSNGHAIWVTKDYIKNKKRVPFTDRWIALCESVGFRLVCHHHAMLVENYGSQLTITGGEEDIATERKSFFRRLAEKKGSPRVDWEDVICFKKG